jgi:uncharacterized protein
VALRHPDDIGAAGQIPLLAERDQLDGKPTAYVCRNFVCLRPTTEPSVVAEQLLE